MQIENLMNKELPIITKDIMDKINESRITLTPFEEKNQILCNTDLQQEVGFKQFDNGDYLVSMTCQMPGITSEMLEWWFWWHAQEANRYKVWFPGEHFSISYNKKNKEYFTQKTMPVFQDNIQYPLEKIGAVKIPLIIKFVSPEEMGFSRKLMDENNIPLIACGHVGIKGGFIMHTEMTHIFKQTPGGLILISRFWIGKLLKNQLIRKFMLTDKTAKEMTEHCCIEYRNLAEILPILYKKYGKSR